jgi:hypothetical protein
MQVGICVSTDLWKITDAVITRLTDEEVADLVNYLYSLGRSLVRRADANENSSNTA